MKALSRRPKPPLDGFVALLWHYEGIPAAHPKERLLPQGTVELVLDLDARPQAVFEQTAPDRPLHLANLAIAGPHSRYFMIDTSRPASVMGVHFHPGGAAAILGLPLDELLNAHLGLEDLWGAEARRLEERLLEARSGEVRLDLMEEALLRLARRPLTRRPAIAHALRVFAASPQVARISEVASSVNLSDRRFIELFKAEVGLTPKLYCRIRRFQAALEAVHRQVEVRWSALAIDGGFYDQAHLANEFRAFAGMTPTDYLRAHTEHLNHVPVIE